MGAYGGFRVGGVGGWAFFSGRRCRWLGGFFRVGSVGGWTVFVWPCILLWTGSPRSALGAGDEERARSARRRPAAASSWRQAWRCETGQVRTQDPKTRNRTPRRGRAGRRRNNPKTRKGGTDHRIDTSRRETPKLRRGDRPVAKKRHANDLRFLKNAI